MAGGQRTRRSDGCGGKLRRALKVCALAAAVSSLSACYPATLDPAGPIAAGERLILLDSLAIMLAIVVPVIVATLAFAWWYRASNARARYLPDWAYSGRAELVVWSIPALVVMFLGGLTWISSHDLDPAQPIPGAAKPLEVQVVSLDWKWLFIYPDQGVASVGQLEIPAGQPVHFQLTSGSVMTAFFVPRLGSMIYTMNGMVTQLNLRADRPGDYPGLASQFSGDGFSNMHFTAQALPPAAFTAWAQGARAAPLALDDAAYLALSRQGVAAPTLHRLADPALFAKIASRQLPPGPGPQSTAPRLASPPLPPT
jgi:cytochrome o ubiquinol oxidase subunit 2